MRVGCCWTSLVLGCSKAHFVGRLWDLLRRCIPRERFGEGTAPTRAPHGACRKERDEGWGETIAVSPAPHSIGVLVRRVGQPLAQRRAFAVVLRT